MDWIKTLWNNVLKITPVWLRVVVIFLVAGVIAIFALSSCGSVTRTVITTQGNDSVQVETQVTKRDSTSVNVNVNPTINFPNMN